MIPSLPVFFLAASALASFGTAGGPMMADITAFLTPSWGLVALAAAAGLAIGWFADALWRFVNDMLNDDRDA